MFAVIFEVCPRPDQREAYLAYAQSLRPDLEKADGFVSNERFSSLRRTGWVLSLSIWRDEGAVVSWRSFAPHREIQRKGRNEVFGDYHLRVGEIVPDNQPATGDIRAPAKLVALTEASLEGLPPEPDAGTVAARLGMLDPASHRGLVDWNAFSSIYNPGKFILLASWRDAAAAGNRPAPEGGGVRHRRIRVVRDYGMFDRAEAPQYYPPAPKHV